MSDQKSAINPKSPTVPVTQTSADMAMYIAIAGRPPEIDPTVGDIVEIAEARPSKPWSPIVLSIYLRDIARQGALKLNRPEISAWIRRQSEVAMKRLHETHERILTSRNDRAA